MTRRLTAALAFLTLAGCDGLILGGSDKGPGIVTVTPDAGPAATLACVSPDDALLGNTVYASKCASCHGAITQSTKANRSATDIRHALDSVMQMAGIGATLDDDDIDAIAAALVTGTNTCPYPVTTTSYTRSTSEVMQFRVSTLFPKAALASMLDPNTTLGQSLGAPDFITAFSVTQPDSASAQAAFLKYVAAPLCKTASTDSTMFSPDDVLLQGETLPLHPDVAMAFIAARNTWLVPYAETSPEVTALVNLIRDLRSRKTKDAEVAQAVCLATMNAPQFWRGDGGPFEPMKRIALDLGGRRPKFSEYSGFKRGSLSLGSYLHLIQAEPGYLNQVKTWHRNWFR